MNMDFGSKKTLVEVIKKEALEELILETFSLTLMVNGIKIHGKNLKSQRILIKIIIAQIIIMLVLINIVLNVEHHYDFRKIMDALIV